MKNRYKYIYIVIMVETAYEISCTTSFMRFFFRNKNGENDLWMFKLSKSCLMENQVNQF